MSDQANDLLAAEAQTRAAQVVAFEEETGTVDVQLVPYEQRALVEEGIYEVFSRGAFASAVAAPHRVKVSNQQHDMRVAIGRAVALREEDSGLYGTLRIADTAAGRDVLTLLREDILDEVSIEFVPQQKHMRVQKLDDGALLVRHDRAVLKGVSPVSHGAYGRGAKVLAVRAQSLADEDAAAREEAARLAAADLATRREAELRALRGLTA